MTKILQSIITRLFTLPYSERNAKQIYVTVTIDVEQDVNENYVCIGTYQNIHTGIPKILSVFDSFHVKGTWLVTPDAVIENKEAIRQLVRDGHEIGCHVHPEYFEVQSFEGLHLREHLSGKSYDLQRNLIHNATKIIEENVGVRPVSFRAGKFGADRNTFVALEKENYLIDTSVTPNINWKREGGSDWSKFNAEPFFIDGRILEVPITILKVFGFRIWYRPSTSSILVMKAIFKRKCVHDNVLPLTTLNMMFHSMETINPNPYTKADLFLRRLRESLAFASSNNAKFVTLHELLKILIANKSG